MVAGVRIVLSATFLISAVSSIFAAERASQGDVTREGNLSGNSNEVKPEVFDQFGQIEEESVTSQQQADKKPSAQEEPKAAEKTTTPPAQPVAKNYEATAAKLAMADALDSKNPAKAEKIFQEALSKFPNDPDLRAIQEGRAMKFHSERARTILDRALAGSSELFGKQWLPGDHLTDRERSIRIQNAKGSRSTALDYDPAAMRALATGYRHINQGDPAKAQEVLTTAINTHDAA
jgi:tetratricopeptide (TPR) repeat protein